MNNMISSDEKAWDVLAKWKTDSSLLQISIKAGSLEFRGRGSIRSIDKSGLSFGWSTASRETWFFEISLKDEAATLSCGSSERDPLGSQVAELRFGSAICIMEGRTPAGSLMPDF